MNTQINTLINILSNLSELANYITKIILQESKTNMIKSISTMGLSKDEIERLEKRDETILNS